MKNHYQTLGLQRDASSDEIKKAYRKLVQKFHPDKNDGDKYFEERFKEVQDAYEILSDPYEKGKYDTNFDYFFNGQQQAKNNTYTHREKYNYEPPKPDPEKVKREREEKEKRDKERAEKERIANIKRNAELPFEDKAWIFLGNWFFLGVLGVIMFFKYRFEGFTKKSNQVCSLSIISIIILFFVTLLITLANH